MKQEFKWPDTEGTIEEISSYDFLDEVWSDISFARLAKCFWFEHLSWLRNLGWDDALLISWPDFIHRQTRVSTQHRTIDLLFEFVEESGLVNAHTGLTSSDIEDNVRKTQLMISINSLGYRLNTLILSLRGQWSGQPMQPGFTHWQPAFAVSAEKRVMSWTAPLDMINGDNGIWGKKFGGPVGDNSGILALFSSLSLGSSMGELQLQELFPWESFLLHPPRNLHPIQSSDHIEEAFLINWISVVAAQLHKIAADMRFLCSKDVLRVSQSKGYIGSSSIPKKNNPIRLEKICSMCRHLMARPRDVLDVLAHNGMERTLDTSWQAKNTYRDCTVTLEKVLIEFLQVEFIFVGDPVESISDDIINEQIKGSTRVEAFLKSN